jgi:hypothetical protein
VIATAGMRRFEPSTGPRRNYAGILHAAALASGLGAAAIVAALVGRGVDREPGRIPACSDSSGAPQIMQ